MCIRDRASVFPCEPEEKALIDAMGLLSDKPVIYVGNMSEDDFIGDISNNENYQKLCALAQGCLLYTSRCV